VLLLLIYEVWCNICKIQRMAELCVKCIFEEFVYVYIHLMLNLIALELVNKIVIKVCMLAISLSGKFRSCFSTVIPLFYESRIRLNNFPKNNYLHNIEIDTQEHTFVTLNLRCNWLCNRKFICVVMNARVNEEHKITGNELGTFVLYFGIYSGESGQYTWFRD